MKQLNQFSILAMTCAVLLGFIPAAANAGNVGWNVSVGGGYGAWRPAAYGPAYGPGWGGWHGRWAYGPGYYAGPYYGPYYGAPVVYAPPPVAYVSPPQPMVLAAQPQPQVWYYCAASGKYYPYVQNCPSGWQTQAATPPTSNVAPKPPQY
jgi:hypothetical protein